MASMQPVLRTKMRFIMASVGLGGRPVTMVESVRASETATIAAYCKAGSLFQLLPPVRCRTELALTARG